MPTNLHLDNALAQFGGQHGSETVPSKRCGQMRPSPVGEEEHLAAWLWAVPCYLFVAPEARPGPILFARIDLMSRCCSQQFSCCHIALKAAALFGV